MSGDDDHEDEGYVGAAPSEDAGAARPEIEIEAADAAGTPPPFDAATTDVNADLVKTLDESQIEERIAAIEAKVGADTPAMQQELAQLNIWQANDAIYRANQRIGQAQRQLAALPLSITGTPVNPLRQQLGEEIDRNLRLITDAEARIAANSNIDGVVPIAQWTHVNPTQDPDFDPKVPIKAKKVAELTKQQVEQRIAAIKAEIAAKPALDPELKQLELWQDKMTKQQLDWQRIRLAGQINALPNPLLHPPLPDQNIIRLELETRLSALVASSRTVTNSITVKEGALALGAASWTYSNYSPLSFGFDENAAVTDASILKIEVADIEKRLKVFTDKVFTDIEAGAPARTLLPQEKNEKLQLELWKAQIEKLDPTLDQAKKDALDAKIAQNKAALQAASIAPWDFGRYVPPKKAAGKAPSATADASHDEEFDPTKTSKNPFDYTVESIMGRMVEALLNGLSRVTGQRLFDLALGVTSIAFNFVGCTGYTVTGGAAGLVAWIAAGVGATGTAKNLFTLHNYLITEGEKLSKDYALIYKPLKYLGLRLFNKDAANAYLDVHKLGDLAGDTTVAHISQLQYLNIVPAALKLAFYSGFTIAQTGSYAGLRIRSMLPSTPQRKAELDAELSAASESIQKNRRAALSSFSELFFKALDAATFNSSNELTGGAANTMDAAYNNAAKWFSPKDPSKSWFSTGNNIVRWERKARELNPKAPINVSPRQPGYFKQRQQAFNAIYEKIDQILSDPNLEPALGSLLSTERAGITTFVNSGKNPDLSELNNFVKTLGTRNTNNIKDAYRNLIDTNNADYITAKHDKITEICNVIDAGLDWTLRDKASVKRALRNMTASPSIAKLEELRADVGDLVADDPGTNIKDVKSLLGGFLQKNPGPDTSAPYTAYIVGALLSPILVPSALFMAAIDRVAFGNGNKAAVTQAAPLGRGGRGPAGSGATDDGDDANLAAGAGRRINPESQHLRRVSSEANNGLAPSSSEERQEHVMHIIRRDSTSIQESAQITESVWQRFLNAIKDLTSFGGGNRKELSERSTSIPGARRPLAMTKLFNNVTRILGLAPKPTGVAPPADDAATHTQRQITITSDNDHHRPNSNSRLT